MYYIFYSMYILYFFLTNFIEFIGVIIDFIKYFRIAFLFKNLSSEENYDAYL